MNVAVPEPPVTVALVGDTDRPDDGLAVIVTVPVNPLTGATVTVMVAVSPALTATLDGLAVIVKSVTLNGSQLLTAGLLFASPL
jgi:hypothetical protein